MSNEAKNREEIAMRRLKAMDLRIKEGLTLRDIGERLGVSYETVRLDLRELIRQETANMEDYIAAEREIASRQLDMMHANAVSKLDKVTTIDEWSKVNAALTRIAERRAKLLGLDAPIRQEIDATIGTAPLTAASARGLMQAMFASSQDLANSEDDESVSN